MTTRIYLGRKCLGSCVRSNVQYGVEKSCCWSQELINEKKITNNELKTNHNQYLALTKSWITPWAQRFSDLAVMIAWSSWWWSLHKACKLQALLPGIIVCAVCIWRLASIQAIVSVLVTEKLDKNCTQKYFLFINGTCIEVSYSLLLVINSILPVTCYWLWEFPPKSEYFPYAFVNLGNQTNWAGRALVGILSQLLHFAGTG